MHIKDILYDSVIQPPGRKPGKLIKNVDKDVVVAYVLQHFYNENKEAKGQHNGAITEDWWNIL